MPVMTPAAVSAAVSASRAEWLSARAALAGQRTGRFAVLASAIFLTVLIALLLVPRFSGAVPAIPVQVVHADTVRLLDLSTAAARAAAVADSQFGAAVLASELVGGTTEGLSPRQRVERDSLQSVASSLDALLARTARAPLPESFRALGASRGLRDDARVLSLLDSLSAIDQRRAELTPSPGAERQFAELTTSMNAVGQSIREIATQRRVAIARSIAELEATTSKPIVIDTAGPRALRDSARVRARAAEATLSAGRLLNQRADSAEARRIEARSSRVPPVAMLVAALVLGLIIGFSLNLASEISRPTIASVREAEQIAAAPVIAVVRERDRTPRVGGIDPFRMLYLGLTATGTRTRTVVVSGDQRAVVAMVAGRLALAAAADARATLVVDADVEGSSVAAYYDERPEPGFSDALASVRLWREVTRPVGASDGLSIDIVPGGALRRAGPDLATIDGARVEFERFRQEYDFCIVVAPGAAAVDRLSPLLELPMTIFCAEVGRTTLAMLHQSTSEVRSAGATLHGLALWDSELPSLPTRSELMAKSRKIQY
jgi:Mrp family chromosome partitioning ATPase